ncbi:MAG TPA: DUF2127 domain-containing protein [Candidatus Sulfotelmatobacter sp.]|nr:DUF2127 domain-containing protein [Candidatus Sulfotelmatobacter sp.]
MKPKARTVLKDTFRATITVKGIDALFEALGGALLWFIPPSAMNSVVRVLSQHELSRDPHDFIALHVLHASARLLSGNKTFAALYLLSHGLTKVVLIIGLWMNELWAYPLTIVVFTLFCAYQMYRYSHTHAISLVLLTIFDLLLIYLTWMEWREQRKARAIQNPAA